MTGLDRPGSSLDEVVLSQVIAQNAAVKLNKPAQRLWHEQVWGVTFAILKANHGPFFQLAEHLHRSERIEGKKMRTILTGVRRITP